MNACASEIDESTKGVLKMAAASFGVGFSALVYCCAICQSLPDSAVVQVLKRQ